MKVVNFNQPKCLVTEKGQYCAFSMNYVPMVAQSKTEIEKVKKQLSYNLMKSKEAFKLENIKTKLDIMDHLEEEKADFEESK